MNREEIVGTVKKLSMGMLDYCDGDLMFFSDLSDDLSDIISVLDESSKLFDLFKYLLDKVDTSMKGNEIPYLQDILNYGFDLSSRLLDSGDTITDFLIDDINLFLSNKKDFTNYSQSASLNDTPVNDVKSTKLAHEINVELDSDVFKIFISESKERINETEELLLELESDLNNRDIINTLFRIFHTIKGESGFLKIYMLGEFAHNIENLLDMIRNNEIKNNPEIIETLFQGVDHLKEIVVILDSGNLDILADIDLEEFLSEVNSRMRSSKEAIGDILITENKISKDDIVKISSTQKSEGYKKRFGEIAIERELISEDDLDEALRKQQKIVEENKKHKTKESDPFIKVKASQINYLVDMIGELLIAENQLEDKNLDKLKKTTLGIQNAAMMLRTVKVKNLFINMKRVVRDLAKQEKKDIEVELIGENLEIDRNLVDSLEAPLTHMLRNSIGHGIESKGNITLMAQRKGNKIVISIIDDGQGLNRDKILEKAISRKLLTEEKATELTDSEIFDFIFMPGFSTAQNIDSISGRGVGMDVVLTNVTSMRGKIEITSRLGEGTQLDLIYPLSMAIIDGMIVRIENDYYIIPVSNIIECLKLDKKHIYSIEGKEQVIKLREEIIPIVNLHTFFHKTADKNQDSTMAIIVEKGSKKYTMLVDDVIAKKEVVIKTLGAKFKQLKGISSATVLTGGKIALILNIEDILSCLLNGEEF